MTAAAQATGTKLMPNSKAPKLEVPTLKGTTWSLDQQQPQNFTMIVFYRGLHCPLCKAYLSTLKEALPDLAQLGVEAIAISGDTQERAQQTYTDWDLGDIGVGYGLSLETMRQWGLYVSKSIKEAEPALFNEPGLFLVKPDGTLYYINIGNAPFGRPPIKDMVGSLEFVLQKNYPTRGTE